MLNRRIKDAATAAFRDNGLLARMSPEDRERAAQFYTQVADETKGRRADLARLYNLERARFLRGEVSRIAPTALEFAREIGTADRKSGEPDV